MRNYLTLHKLWTIPKIPIWKYSNFTSEIVDRNSSHFKTRSKNNRPCMFSTSQRILHVVVSKNYRETFKNQIKAKWSCWFSALSRSKLNNCAINKINCWKFRRHCKGEVVFIRLETLCVRYRCLMVNSGVIWKNICSVAYRAGSFVAVQISTLSI